jgi:hypothetical protein
MGLLDFLNTDEGQQGMGLLSAAAPSMAPQNLAGRLAMGVSNYQALKERSYQEQLKAIQLQGAMRDNSFMSSVYDRFNNASQPQESQPQQAPRPVPGDMYMPGGMVSNVMGNQPAQSQQPQPMQSGGGSFGLSPDAFLGAAMGGRGELGKAIVAANSVPDALKLNRMLGISDATTADATRRELATKGQWNLRGGSTLGTTDANGVPTPLYTAPSTAENAQFSYKNGVLSSAPIENMTTNVQAMRKAETSGVNEVTPQEGVDPITGERKFTNKLNAATGGMSNTSGAGRYPGQGPTNTQGVLAPGLSPAASAAGEQAGTGSGKQFVADNAAANGYGARVYTLKQALSNLENADVGPGSASSNNIKSFLLSQTPGDLGKFLPRVDPEKIQSYDEANKYMIQYAMGKASQLGEGTDAKLATTLSGNASTSISKLASTDVVKANLGLEDMQNAQIRAFNASGQPPQNYQKFSTNWNANVNPSVFVWDYATPANRAKIAANMSPDERTQFTNQYNAALQSRYIKGPGK